MKISLGRQSIWIGACDRSPMVVYQLSVLVFESDLRDCNFNWKGSCASQTPRLQDSWLPIFKIEWTDATAIVSAIVNLEIKKYPADEDPNFHPSSREWTSRSHHGRDSSLQSQNQGKGRKARRRLELGRKKRMKGCGLETRGLLWDLA